MIDPKTIQLILDAARIEDVVGDIVNLRRSGTNLTGLCPFHNEKTPSFSVSPAKGIFKCFGCGKGGDSVGFIMEHENCSYPEALRTLARKYNIELEEIVYTKEVQDEKLRIDGLYLVNEFAKEYYSQQLTQTDYGKSVGLAYFKQRGLSIQTVERFGLGFSPPSQNPSTQDDFTQYALKKGYSLDMLKQGGLTRQEGRDFFRNRVLFPIHNVSGRVVGFGGRVMDAKLQPKYLNTAETEIYNKSKLLYGIYHAKKAIRQLDECILTEGYLDVVSLSQAGIENVVASSGTSLTTDQIHLIKRHTNNIKILYDGDAAGIKAALRGLDMVLEQGLNVRIVLFPLGEDPDSYVQKIGADAFKTFITDEAKDFILFKTTTLLKEVKNDPVQKIKVLKDIVESISKIPEPIARSVYIRECSVLLQMNEQILTEEVNKIKSRNITAANNAAQARTNTQTPLQTTPQKPQNKANKTASPDFEPNFYDEDSFPSPDTPNILAKEENNPTGEEFQERAVAKILIQYGTKIIKKNMPLAHFVLVNMEDLLPEIDEPSYKMLIEECLLLANKGELPQTPYFLQHEKKELRTLAVTLLSLDEQYLYSENWVKMHEKPLFTQELPDENYEREAINTVNHFKWRKMQRVLEKNRLKLSELDQKKRDGEPVEGVDFIILLKMQMKIKKMVDDLAKELKIDGAV
ncbi:MAG: primase [Bacteroidota bacterium]